MTDRLKGMAGFRIPLVVAGVMSLIVGAAIQDIENLPRLATTFQSLGVFALAAVCISRVASYFDGE